MGCDIHGMIERKDRYGWINAGDPDCNRDYDLFAVIGNVRNYRDSPFIGEQRISMEALSECDFDCCDEYRCLALQWDVDGHSHSFVTLAEMKAFDLNQKIYDPSLVISRDENGKITSTCQSTTGSHMGPVGDTTIFGTWGTAHWDRIIAFMEDVRAKHELADDQVRWIFFFDN